MEFDERRLSDPSYYSENCLPAHSDHIAYASAEECEEGRNSLRLSLNGYWKFFHAMNPRQVIDGFEKNDYDCRPWADIAVPAHIQMEGYGHPQYCNVQYPWDGLEDPDVGQMPEYFNPVGCYVKYFMLPAGWENKRVIVSFQGVESCVALWLNGFYIGFASDSFTPDEFELTPYIRSGENKLACRVYRWNVSSWLEDQDFMRFSGIFRDVWLQAIPDAHLTHIETDAIPTEDMKTGKLSCRMDIFAPGGAEIRLRLIDSAPENLVEEKTVHASNGRTEVEFDVSDPHLWSSEDPHLYTLLIDLYDRKGRNCEHIRQKIGFRLFEIKDSIMYLNGVRIVFKGTDRHDFCGETGRAVPAEKIRRDLIIMKRNNINAIRTSHYPNSSVLYSLADELGLYVIDECNMETHDFFNSVHWGKLPLDQALPGDRKEYLNMMLDRADSIGQRDRNHPCVLMWSCGNESYGGSVILKMSRYFKDLDPTRPVHYEGVSWDPRYPETSDIY
ncbi:MAG: beta-galactosidase, partial [Clostridiales bacterium]|nr:beta-galactosidase [Clostridiales bacterium]